MTDTLTSLPSGATASDRVLLDEIRRRRSELRESMTALESALAAAVGDDHGRWAVRVHVALVELSADLRLHVHATEGPRGLHQELVDTEPRTAGAVERLARDHVRMRAALDALLLLLDGPYPVSDAEAIRSQAVALLGDLARHRQRGADVVYEALHVDVGGET